MGRGGGRLPTLLHVLLTLLAAAAVAATAQYTPTPHGALVAVGGVYNVEMAVEGMTSFRLSVVNGTSRIPTRLTTGNMVVAKTAFANFTVGTSGTLVALHTAFGSVTINTATGSIQLSDAAGKTLTTAALPLSDPAPTPATDVGGAGVTGNNTCPSPHAGWDAVNPQRSSTYPNGIPGATQASCCAACDADVHCTAWVYATDDEAPNCWPLAAMAGVDTGANQRILGGVVPPPPPPPAATLRLTFHNLSAGSQILGSGTDGGAAQTLVRTSAQASTNNMGSWTPSFWCSDGWSVLGVSPFVDSGPTARNHYPVAWSRDAPGSVTLAIMGGSDGAPNVDVYLTPAATLRAHVSGQAALEGPPAMLPRYALGFLACRWGEGGWGVEHAWWGVCRWAAVAYAVSGSVGWDGSMDWDGSVGWGGVGGRGEWCGAAHSCVDGDMTGGGSSSCVVLCDPACGVGTFQTDG